MVEGKQVRQRSVSCFKRPSQGLAEAKELGYNLNRPSLVGFEKPNAGHDATDEKDGNSRFTGFQGIRRSVARTPGETGERTAGEGAALA